MGRSPLNCLYNLDIKNEYTEVRFIWSESCTLERVLRFIGPSRRLAVPFFLCLRSCQPFPL